MSWLAAGWLQSLALGFLAFLTVACQGQDPLPPGPAIIEVTMYEFRFELPHRVAEGRAVFRVTNAGQLPHQLTLQRLPADFPPMFAQIRSDTPRAAPAVALMPELGPGASGTFAADLAPGRYGIVSFARDAGGVTDVEKGMGAEFFVG